MKLTSSQSKALLTGWALFFWNTAKFTFFYCGWMIMMFALEGLILNDFHMGTGMLTYGVVVTAWMIIRMIRKKQKIRLTIVSAATVIIAILMYLGV